MMTLMEPTTTPPQKPFVLFNTKSRLYFTGFHKDPVKDAAGAQRYATAEEAWADIGWEPHGADATERLKDWEVHEAGTSTHKHGA